MGSTKKGSFGQSYHGSGYHSSNMLGITVELPTSLTREENFVSMRKEGLVDCISEEN